MDDGGESAARETDAGSAHPVDVEWTDAASRRAAVETAIAGLDLPDAVLTVLLLDERHPAPEGAPRLALSELLPDLDAANLVTWMRAAFALVRSAEAYGERHVTGGESGPALVQAMAAEHPGFSPKSYGAVLFHGVSRRHG